MSFISPHLIALYERYCVDEEGRPIVYINQPPHATIGSGGIYIEDGVTWYRIPAFITPVETTKLRQTQFGARYEGMVWMYYDPVRVREAGFDIDIQIAEVMFNSKVYKVESIVDFEYMCGFSYARLVREL